MSAGDRGGERESRVLGPRRPQEAVHCGLVTAHQGCTDGPGRKAQPQLSPEDAENTVGPEHPQGTGLK